MKRKIIALMATVALAAIPAFAGLGPNAGLPLGWGLSGAEGYGSIAGINGNPASAMCVGCHTVNPSDAIVVPSAYGTHTTLARSAANIASHFGTHFVMNVIATPGVGVALTDLLGSTNIGGADYGITPGATAVTDYQKVTAWSSTALSKYANDTTLTSQTSVGGMICESCHNIVNNVAGTRLLVEAYSDDSTGTMSSALCQGCHDDMHGGGNIASLSNTSTRKDHHVMNDAAYTDLVNTGSALTWAPSYSNMLDADWCGAGAYSAPSAPSTIAADAALSFRGLCNTSGQGVYAPSGVMGDISVSAINQLQCASCHRPHNAATGAGAHILRIGSNAVEDFPGKKGNSRATLDTEAAGIRRGIDVGSAAGKVYGEYITLCKGCHQGYGS